MPIQEKKMAVTVETLDKLERKITLTLPVDVIAKEVDSRLKRLSRQVKVDGFRPGKVPMNIIGQRYGYQVQYEVMNDKVGEVSKPLQQRPICVWQASPASAKKKARLRAKWHSTLFLKSSPKSKCPICRRWRSTKSRLK